MNADIVRIARHGMALHCGLPHLMSATPSIERVAKALYAFIAGDSEEAQALPAIQYVANRNDRLAQAAIAAARSLSEQEGS